MAVRVFTRFFEGKGTVFLNKGTPDFDSRIKPGHGDIIYSRNGSVLQVHRLGQRLVEVLIEGPPKGFKLPSSWQNMPSDLE